MCARHPDYRIGSKIIIAPGATTPPSRLRLHSCSTPEVNVTLTAGRSKPARPPRGPRRMKVVKPGNAQVRLGSQANMGVLPSALCNGLFYQKLFAMVAVWVRGASREGRFCRYPISAPVQPTVPKLSDAGRPTWAQSCSMSSELDPAGIPSCLRSSVRPHPHFPDPNLTHVQPRSCSEVPGPGIRQLRAGIAKLLNVPNIDRY